MVLFVLSMSLYIIFIIFMVYIYFIADPKTSSTAKFIVEIVPQRIWQYIQNNANQRIVDGLEFIIDRFMMIVYLSVFMGSWSYVYMNVFPWIDEQNYLPNYHKVIASITSIGCFLSWRVVSITRPGIITSRNLQYYNHYPYDNLLFVEGINCRTKHIPKLARSKFDRYKYNENIAKFDHYCGWVYNTIGEENYRWFLLFLLLHVYMLGYGTYCFYTLFQGEISKKNLWNVTFVDRNTGQEIKPTSYIIFQYLFQYYMIEIGITIICSVMFIALTLFLGYHCYLTSIGMTSNESAKWEQINKWYNRELQLYNDAVANGTIQPNNDKNHNNNNNNTKVNNTNTPPPIVDGDVTCTGMKPEENESTVTIENETQQPNDENDIQHPGPRPINIYNRSIYENWKEVIFPISLQKIQQAKRQRQLEIKKQR